MSSQAAVVGDARLTTTAVDLLRAGAGSRHDRGSTSTTTSPMVAPALRESRPSALARRIAKHAAHAAERCPSLTAKTITPHVLRHTAAMRLLHAGVDTTVIALWLGHEQVEPRRCTCAPTPRSKNEHSRAPSRWTANSAATARQTRSCDSWTHCEHVVLSPVVPAATAPLAGRDRRVALLAGGGLLVI